MLALQMLPAGVVASTSENNPPVIDPVADVTAPEKSLIHVEMTASDADGDSLTFEAITLPAGATWQQNTSTQAYLKWIPEYDQAGTHLVKFRVRDEVAAPTAEFNINVTDVNRAPYLDVIRNEWTEELEELAFNVKAYDPDGDSLSYSIASIPTPDHNNTTLPAGVRFADGANNDAAFAWTPDCTQGAPFDPLNGGGKRYQFITNVTDGEANHTRQFNVTVYHVDTAPTLDAQPFRLGVEGTTLKFLISGAACDIENHTLEVGLVAATQAGITPPELPSPLPSSDLPDGVTVTPERPENMTYDNVTEIYFSNFTWEIGFQQAGNYTFYADMQDEAGNADNITFIIKVTDFNTAPEFDVFPAFHDPLNATFWAKEDTRFNMTAPLGFYGAENPAENATWSNTAQRFDCFATISTGNNTSVQQQIPCGDTLATSGGLIPEACANDNTTVCVDANLTGYPTGFSCDWANITYPIPCGTPFVVTATDNENDTIFWNLDWLSVDGKSPQGDVLPEGMRFIAPGTNWTTGQSNNGTNAVAANMSFALLRWIPGYDAAGTYEFRLWATDGANLTEKYFTINVENTNRRPILPAPQGDVILEGETVRFEVTGTEYDFLDKNKDLRDDMSFRAFDLPPGAQWQPGRDEQAASFHGTFIWTPGYHQAGTYTVRLVANDTDDRRLFPSSPLGYGNDIPTALYLEAPPVMPTPWDFEGQRTEFSNETNITIVVENVDRAPVIDDIPDVAYQVGATVNLLVHAEDADGDNLTMNVTGLPSAVSLVNDSVGPGWFDGRLFGSALDGGVHAVTVEACSGFPEVCANTTFTLVVIVDTDFEIQPEQSVYKTAPETDVVIPLRVENTGPANPDVINFEVTIGQGTIVSYTQNVTVASTDAGWANLTVRVPADVAETTVRIRATSTMDTGFSKEAQVQIRVPVLVSTTITQTLPGVSGAATITFVDGTPLVALPATATQSPSTNPFGSLSTSVSGHVNSTGVFNFSFGALDAKANAPGAHEVVVSVEYGGKTFTGKTSYTIEA